LARWLLELLFPPRCVFCGRLTRGETVCAECRASLPLCGDAGKAEFCSAVAAPFRYEGRVRESILRYKFGGRRGYAAVYAGFLAETAERELAGKYDLVSWVPVSARRLRKRGYDQARLLAEKTAQLLGTQAVQTLAKPRDNPPQSGLDRPEKRRANVSGVYAVRGQSAAGRRVLLVDDIATTGATLSECARTLLMAGAEDVCGLVLAAARRERFGAGKSGDNAISAACGEDAAGLEDFQ